MNQPDQMVTQREMAELERRRLVAASLRNTLIAINSDLSIDKLLDFIVNQALPLLSADAVAIYQLNPNGELSLQSLVGMPLESILRAEALIERIATKQAVLTKRPVFCPNLSDNFIETDFPIEKTDSFKEIIKTYRSILAVPIEIRNESYGVLTLFFIKRHKLIDDELDLAIDFSMQAALAIDNARMRIIAQQNAVNQERNHLARELHDSVIQNLFSASLIAETLPKVMELDPEKGLEGLSELQLLTRGALAEMRSLLLELRPRAIEDARLEELLKQITEAASGRLRKTVNLTYSGQFTMPVDVRLTFYRIAQEAINNVVKHAEANSISIILKCKGNPSSGNCTKALLKISDDGRGFNEPIDNTSHLGFKIMRERAEMIGAKLSIKSRINRGTTIQLNWKSQENIMP